MPRPLRFSERLDRFPPILVRLLVVRGRGKGPACYVPTDAQLANACGLSMADFKWVSYSTTWADIPDRVKYAYLRGCDIDLERARCFHRLEWMRKNGRFTHLKRSPLWEPQLREQLELYVSAEEGD